MRTVLVLAAVLALSAAPLSAKDNRVDGAAATHENVPAVPGAPAAEPSPRPDSSPNLTDPLRSTGPLPLDVFLRRAVRSDTEFERILIDALDLRYERSLRLPPRDLVLDVRQELELSLDDGAENVTETALTSLFPMSGTEVSVAYRTLPGAGGRTDFSDVTLSVAQSIAENAFGRSTRLLDQIVGLEIDVARHQIVEAYEDYLALVAGIYLDWWEARETLAIARSSLEQNRRLLDNMRARRRSRIALPIDVDKVELQVLEREQGLVEAEEAWQNRTNLVERVLRIDDASTLEPVAPRLDPPEMPFEESFGVFQREGRTLSILQLLEERSSLDIEREADDLLPSVDLLLTFRSQGTGIEISRAENEILAGVAVQFPFRDPVQRAELEVAKIALEKAELDTRNVRAQLEADLRNVRLAIDREYRLAGLADDKVALARRILDAEAENYSYAKITLNDYIQAVNTLDTNRFEQARRQTAWRKLVLEWRRLTDRLADTREVLSRVP